MSSQVVSFTILLGIGSCLAAAQFPSIAAAQDVAVSSAATLEQVKAAGALQSSYRKSVPQAKTVETPKANLKAFRTEIEPALKKACYECHGSETAEGEFRVDRLDPDLLHGDDVSWWLEVSSAVTNGEMPPEDGPKLADDERNKIIDWLSSEIQLASQVRRAEQGYSSFRRMTRYEYNYALQDLLGLELDFVKDLPPEPVSEDGFKNSSETLQITTKQYATYLERNRDALNRATIRGERPEVLYWGVSAERASAEKFPEFDETDEPSENEPQVTQARGRQRGGRGRRGGKDGRSAHYKKLSTDQTVPATWNRKGVRHRFS